jgi:hypothetical protein
MLNSNEKMSTFYENSKLDQDDAYANYRPIFAIKNNKVTGRTEEIIKL